MQQANERTGVAGFTTSADIASTALRSTHYAQRGIALKKKRPDEEFSLAQQQKKQDI